MRYIFAPLLLFCSVCVSLEFKGLQNSLKELAKKPGDGDNSELLSLSRVAGLDLTNILPRTQRARHDEVAFPVFTELPMRETKNGRILDCLTEIGYWMVEGGLDETIKIREEFRNTMREFVKDNFEADQKEHLSLSSPRSLNSDASIDPILKDYFQELVTSPTKGSEHTKATEKETFDDSKLVTSLVKLAVQANDWDTMLRHANWLTTLRNELLKDPNGYGFTNRHWMGYAIKMRHEMQRYKPELTCLITLDTEFDKKNAEYLIKDLPKEGIPRKKQKDTYNLRQKFRIIANHWNSEYKIHQEKPKVTYHIRRKFWINAYYWNSLQHTLQQPDWKSEVTRAKWHLGMISENFDNFLKTHTMKKNFLKTLQDFLKFHINEKSLAPDHI
ncbi:uncharacterized protein MELLADRAFT_109690 [Melampsora larici-populina 98AG31]|uniref:Secreted protein n=1 Tax=Melampsora larici-populina (strain 98AG31 / pathotype 3-4-7) TaxID=747676 RepID=F4RXB0_MELLP|nr:uncharacterized protein MELLADRAFT_109690 [Melampsora larici-populina 98AG31]EGG02935.1 hypothetical protein MELLADRAFT_109690 [Melampsora larici-populina 98AG31]